MLTQGLNMYLLRRGFELINYTTEHKSYVSFLVQVEAGLRQLYDANV